MVMALNTEICDNKIHCLTSADPAFLPQPEEADQLLLRSGVRLDEVQQDVAFRDVRCELCSVAFASPPRKHRPPTVPQSLQPCPFPEQGHRSHDLHFAPQKLRSPTHIGCGENQDHTDDAHDRQDHLKCRELPRSQEHLQGEQCGGAELDVNIDLGRPQHPGPHGLVLPGADDEEAADDREHDACVEGRRVHDDLPPSLLARAWDLCNLRQ
mmetsp:Transcript_146759/g.468853  ORF Transcript_146759/g.468853 Transcript_146759/m.468853 type:complete len:211 (-) Transcript_146759:1481-2113(-)